MTLEMDGVRIGPNAAPRLDVPYLRLEVGQVHAVLGPNGAGKSTLMAVLAGALQPDAGLVRFMGQPWASWSLSAAARRRAWLPQQQHMPFDLRAEQVVALGRHAHVHRPHPREGLLIGECLTRAGAQGLTGRFYQQLSGGEQARIQWARVLAQLVPHPLEAGPTWLMLDEPNAALDLRHQRALMAVAREHAEQGGGVLVVLHDLALAAQWADQVLVLQEGRLCAQGDVGHTLTADMIQRVWGVTALWHRVPGEARERLSVA